MSEKTPSLAPEQSPVNATAEQVFASQRAHAKSGHEVTPVEDDDFSQFNAAAEQVFADQEQHASSRLEVPSNLAETRAFSQVNAAAEQILAAQQPRSETQQQEAAEREANALKALRAAEFKKSVDLEKTPIFNAISESPRFGAFQSDRDAIVEKGKEYFEDAYVSDGLTEKQAEVALFLRLSDMEKVDKLEQNLVKDGKSQVEAEIIAARQYDKVDESRKAFIADNNITSRKEYNQVKAAKKEERDAARAQRAVGTENTDEPAKAVNNKPKTPSKVVAEKPKAQSEEGKATSDDTEPLAVRYYKDGTRPSTAEGADASVKSDESQNFVPHHAAPVQPIEVSPAPTIESTTDDLPSAPFSYKVPAPRGGTSLVPPPKGTANAIGHEGAADEGFEDVVTDSELLAEHVKSLNQLSKDLLESQAIKEAGPDSQLANIKFQEIMGLLDQVGRTLGVADEDLPAYIDQEIKWLKEAMWPSATDAEGSDSGTESEPQLTDIDDGWQDRITPPDTEEDPFADWTPLDDLDDVGDVFPPLPEADPNADPNTAGENEPTTEQQTTEENKQRIYKRLLTKAAETKAKTVKRISDKLEKSNNKSEAHQKYAKITMWAGSLSLSAAVGILVFGEKVPLPDNIRDPLFVAAGGLGAVALGGGYAASKISKKRNKHLTKKLARKEKGLAKVQKWTN